VRAAGLFFLLFATLLSMARSARAHDPFEVTTTGRVRAASIELEVTMTRKAASRLAAARGDASFDLAALAAELYSLSVAGKPLALRATSTRPLEADELVFHATYERPASRALHLEATHVIGLGEGYTSALELSVETPPRSLGFHVLTATDPSRDFVLAASPPEVAPSEGRAGAFASFFRLGIEHILTGYDHLLFLAGLLLAARTLRSTLLLVSAFTFSHSLTLALSILGWVALPQVLVESAIAASIVVVGVENLWLEREPRHRAFVVFGFGLVHGLGFAGALKEASVGSAPGELLTRLAGFNLGVEAGQLGLALLALPLLRLAKRHPRGPVLLAAASLVIGLTGAYWFADRSLFS
jgi:hydrogenase/urease accessory protein HupE